MGKYSITVYTFGPFQPPFPPCISLTFRVFPPTPLTKDRISNLVGSRDASQVVKQVKKLKMKTVRKAPSSVVDVPIKKKATAEKPWSEVEQGRLEHGLRTVSKTLEKDERWGKIADIVRTRTKEECVQRYRYIAAMLKRTSIAKHS